MFKIKRDFAAAIVFSAIAAFVASNIPAVTQVINPGTPTSGNPANNDCAKYVVSGGNVQSITTAGGPCAAAVSGANPTATAGPNAVNGTASTFMRSDAAPAIQPGTATQQGILECGAGTNCAAGVISTALPANPTATATTNAVNGTASTYMRSDAAPAVAKTTFGGQSVGPGQTATATGTGAQIATSTGTHTSNNCAHWDANGNVTDAGSPCGGATGANPTATAGAVANNGVASTYMRSDASPAVALATNAVQGIMQGDGTSINCSSGACNTVAATKSDQQTGTNTKAAVTPSTQQYHNSSVKAWVKFNGSTGAILSSYNISGSITVNSTGNYTINFATPFSSSDYACNVTPQSGSSFIGVVGNPTPPTASAVTILTFSSTTGAAGSAAFVHVSCEGID